MAREELVGKAQTVLGPVDGDSLGTTLVHEHLLHNESRSLKKPVTDSEKRLSREPLQLKNLYLVRLNPFCNLDNLILKDEQLIIKEAMLYKSAGGNTIVDVTTGFVGRNPRGLVNIARKTGLNIVMGTGYFIAPAHPPEVATKTEQELTDGMIRDITVGVDNTGIRAGIIGEIGCSTPLEERERKVLRCCAFAQRQTGVAIYIHPGPGEDTAWEITRILSEAGADLSRVIIGHVDLFNYSIETCHRLMDAGYYIAYDNFGQEGFFQVPHVTRYFETNDISRINDIIKLVGDGYLNQILVSQDVATKERLASYGGTGYAHILRDVVPIMRIKGMSDEQIRTLLVENPKRVLPFAPIKD